MSIYSHPAENPVNENTDLLGCSSEHGHSSELVEDSEFGTNPNEITELVSNTASIQSNSTEPTKEQTESETMKDSALIEPPANLAQSTATMFPKLLREHAKHIKRRYADEIYLKEKDNESANQVSHTTSTSSLISLKSNPKSYRGYRYSTGVPSSFKRKKWTPPEVNKDLTAVEADEFGLVAVSRGRLLLEKLQGK